MDVSELKTQVLLFAKRYYDETLMAGISGNLSALSDDGKIVITPGSVDYCCMTVCDIMVYAFHKSMPTASTPWFCIRQALRSEKDVTAFSPASRMPQVSYMGATYTEDAAKIYHMAKATGKPIILTAEQRAEMRC